MNTHSPQQRPSLFYRPNKLMTLATAVALAACGSGDPQPAFDSKPGLSLYAGALGGSGNIDGLPGRFSLGYGNGIALDTAGNIYVSDNNGSTIRRISPSGVVTTLAGQAGLNGSLDGTGPQARFGYAGKADITGMEVDGAGSVYVADVDNNTIRKITPDGVVTTLAGTAGKCGATDGPLSLALFCRPQGLALDMAGTLYVADNSQLIRKITPDGMVTTLAGHLDSGIRVATDGAGAAAGFGTVAGLAVNALGEVLAVDWGAIRKITAAGVVTTLAGTAGVRGSADGVGPAASFSNARGIAIDGVGNAFIADSLNFTIRKITPSGVVSTLAGQAMSAGGYQDGSGQVARFHHPVALAVNNSGALVVTDSFNHVIRGISQSGTVSTLAGMAPTPGAADGAAQVARFAANAQNKYGGVDYLDSVRGIAVDAQGNIYVADTGNDLIRKITPDQTVSTLAGMPRQADVPAFSQDGAGTSARFNLPQGLAVDGNGNVYVADTASHIVRKVDPSGVVTTLAGSNAVAGSVDGMGTNARFSNPEGIAVDRDGNIFVADAGNRSIRKIARSGEVTTLRSLDGKIYLPGAVATDRDGNVYIAERDALCTSPHGPCYPNPNVRNITRITPGNVVTVVAMTGVAATASFSNLQVDSAGNVYVTDTNNSTISKMTPDGSVTVVAGRPGSFGVVPGDLPALMNRPLGLAIHADTNLFTISENSVLRIQLPQEKRP